MRLETRGLHGALRFEFPVRCAAGGIFSARRPSCGVQPTTYRQGSRALVSSWLLSSPNGEKRNGHGPKSTFANSATTPAVCVHRAMARRLRAAASVFFNSSTTHDANGHDTSHRANENTTSTSSGVLIQAGAFRRLLSYLSGEKRNEDIPLSTFATTSTPRVNRSLARRFRAPA